MITKEALQSRLASLQERKDSLLSDANAVHGAIQECSFWLYQLEQENKKEEAPAS